jgi:uroporphyrinogen-III synthase
VVLIEGWNFRQVRDALARQTDLKPDSAALDDAALMRALGAEASHPEGLFAPDTYAYSRGTSDMEVLRRAYRLQQQRLQNAWNSRATTPGAPPLRTPYEALILASIVEKETGKEADRVRVASVFANRLNRAMMLQSDPTTIYGMGEQFDGNLRRRDLRADTPYNTYTRHGLPPTPIAMPGKASLRGVMAAASFPMTWARITGRLRAIRRNRRSVNATQRHPAHHQGHADGQRSGPSDGACFTSPHCASRTVHYLRGYRRGRQEYPSGRLCAGAEGSRSHGPSHA